MTELYLICNYAGVPIPEVFWLLNGSVVDTTNPDISVILEDDVSGRRTKLLWQNASASARGEYLCIATNFISSTSRNINVLIASNN